MAQAVDTQGPVLHVRQPPIHKRVVAPGSSAIEHGQTLHHNNDDSDDENDDDSR